MIREKISEATNQQRFFILARRIWSAHMMRFYRVMTRHYI